MTIRLLQPDVVAKIAAGEVIERPSSVVKELVENSIDAGASAIQVELVAGGCDLIRVSDDGGGIEREELAVAVQRHATSKITGIEDLARVRSLGFRGEALASVAAVSEFAIVTRPASGPAHGLRVVGGVAQEVEAASRAPGTSVTVERLFFNLPARRKFLRSSASESGQVAHLLSQFGIAYPEIAFELVSDGRRVLSTPGSGDFLDAAVAVLGRTVASALVPVDAVVDSDLGVPGATAVVRGHAAEPEVTRATRSGIWLFVNRRPVRSRALTHAVEEGYRTLLLAGRFPVALLNLDVPPTDVDVNVHPAKAEVKLLKERTIYAGVRDAVRAALTSADRWGKEISGLVSSPGNAPGSSPELPPDRLLDAPLAPPSHPGAGAPLTSKRLPILRLMGQVAQTYIVAEGEQGLYLIDQHAAHERILLNRFLGSSREKPGTQLLLDPVALELTPAQATAAASALGALESVGYQLESFGDSSLLVRGVPADLAGNRSVEILLESLDELSQEAQVKDWRERIAISLSCRGAIKSGQVLSGEEMRSLVEALEETDISQHCSHGRPTAIVLSRTQLDREFGRR